MRPTTSRSVFPLPEVTVTDHVLADGSLLTLLRIYERGSLPLYRLCHDDLVLWEGHGAMRAHQRFLTARRALGD